MGSDAGKHKQKFLQTQLQQTITKFLKDIDLDFIPDENASSMILIRDNAISSQWLNTAIMAYCALYSGQ